MSWISCNGRGTVVSSVKSERLLYLSGTNVECVDLELAGRGEVRRSKKDRQHVCVVEDHWHQPYVTGDVACKAVDIAEAEREEHQFQQTNRVPGLTSYAPRTVRAKLMSKSHEQPLIIKTEAGGSRMATWPPEVEAVQPRVWLPSEMHGTHQDEDEIRCGRHGDCSL